MIHSLPQIKINGSSSFAGGVIYNIQYVVGYGDSKSVVKVSVISESGNYNINSSILNNTYCNTYTINIGDQISFTGFLEGYSYSASPSGKVLELEFVDDSRILDVIYVGLYKRHGIKSTKHLILVGKEIDACNPEGYADPIEQFYDPCNPCITNEGINARVNYIDCVEKARYEINDVKYNFTELLTQMSTRSFKVRGAVDINPNYLARHTGTLRQVLLAWCSEFGFFFYWDKGSIIFKDSRNTIQVNAAISSFCPNLVDYTEKYSMSNSLKTATITNFSRPGDPAKIYSCQEAKYIECESLRQNATYTMPLTVSPKIDSIAAGLAYYNEILRDLYYYYVKYQMYNSVNFFNGNKLEKLGMKILSNRVSLGALRVTGQNISSQATPAEFLSLEVKKQVISLDPFTLPDEKLSNAQRANRTAILANPTFESCVRTLDAETQWKIIATPYSYYFFLAQKNETIENNYLSEEKRFADFLNKYAVYVPDENDPFFTDSEFVLDQEGLCGYNYFVNTGNITYQALGDNTGNFKFYNTSSQENSAILGDLPFAEFLSVIRDTRSSTSNPGSQIPFKLIVVDRGRNSFIPSPATKIDKNVEAIIDYDLLSKARNYLPYQITNKSNLQGGLVARIAGADIATSTLNNVYLYLGHAASEDDFELTQVNGFNNFATVGTLFDGKPLNRENNPQDQRESIIYQYPDLKCKIIGNHSFGNRAALHANRVIFKTPVASFKYTEPTDALFGVVVEKTHIKRRIVEKIESFNQTNLDDDSCNYSKLAVNYQNISDDRLKILTRSNRICEYNQAEIKTIHDEFSANLTTVLTEPSISKTFKIAGVELTGYTPSIENGLLSINVSIDDKGVFSTYEFGTRLMTIPNIETLTFGRGLNSDQPGSYTNTVNYYPTVKE